MSSKLRAFSLGCVAAALSWSAQAAVVTLDFEALGLAAPSTGMAVGDYFTKTYDYGLTFSANALAFHNGQASDNDSITAISARAGNFGYVRSPFGNSGYTSFQIDIAGKNYDQFSLTLGVAALEVDIYAYDALGNVLNSDLHTFSNASGFAWASPYTLVDGSKKTNIAYITFNLATKGLFAIDNLTFTEAGTPGGGTVPEPAGLGLVALALAAAGLASRRAKSA